MCKGVERKGQERKERAVEGGDVACERVEKKDAKSLAEKLRVETSRVKETKKRMRSCLRRSYV